MRAEFTQYVVPGWGVGELWTADTILVAHEFRFGAERQADTGDDLSPPMGGADAPSGPLSRYPQRVGNVFVSTSEHPSTRALARSAPAGEGDDSGRGGMRGRGVLQSAPATLHPSTTSAAPRPLDVADLVDRFRAFFRGDDVPLEDVPIDLDGATAFQRALAGALRRTPRGEVVTYAELAVLAGYPGAARAAGTFCARNRFMLVVPCHRVVGASDIGGYGSAGVETKRRLLALEGVDL